MGGYILLINFLVFGIGFSSFYIISNSINNNIKLDIGNIYTLNNYIDYGNISSFEFCSKGIVDNDVVVDNGSLTVGFKIDLSSSKVKNDLISNHLKKGTNSLKLSIKLYDNNALFDLFSEQSKYINEAKYNYANNNYPSVEGNMSFFPTILYRNDGTNNYAEGNFEIDDRLNSSTLYFRITYKFKFDLEKFETEIYNKLVEAKETSFKLSFNAEVDYE